MVLIVENILIHNEQNDDNYYTAEVQIIYGTLSYKYIFSTIIRDKTINVRCLKVYSVGYSHFYQARYSAR